MKYWHGRLLALGPLTAGASVRLISALAYLKGACIEAIWRPHVKRNLVESNDLYRKALLQPNIIIRSNRPSAGICHARVMSSRHRRAQAMACCAQYRPDMWRGKSRHSREGDQRNSSERHLSLKARNCFAAEGGVAALKHKCGCPRNIIWLAGIRHSEKSSCLAHRASCKHQPQGISAA